MHKPRRLAVEALEARVVLSNVGLAGPGLAAPLERVIVMLSDDVADAPALAQSLVRASAGKLLHVYEHALKGFAAELPPGAIAALQKNPHVEIVEKDLVMEAFGWPDGAAKVLPTGVDRIDVDAAFGDKDGDGVLDIIDDAENVSYKDRVDVAIIDTGIRNLKLWTEPSGEDYFELNVAGGVNFVNAPGGNDNWIDGNGHGTHVAGIVGARDNVQGVVGVAPGANLWAVRVLDNNGYGYLTDIVKGIDWVTGSQQGENPIEVANMSLGIGSSTLAQRTLLRDAITRSVAAGVVYTVAAGNSKRDVYGRDGKFNTNDDFIPAAFPEVATISAMVDSDGKPGGLGPRTSYGYDDSFASFSNYSRSVVVGNPVVSPGKAIDLVLPGVDIWSTWLNGYVQLSGTSMAAPHAAGLAALYIAGKGTRDVNGDNYVNQYDVYAIRQALIDNGKAQTSPEGFKRLNDPDGNQEHLGWAPSVVIASTNQSDVRAALYAAATWDQAGQQPTSGKKKAAVAEVVDYLLAYQA